MISVINKTKAQIKKHKLLIKLNYRYTAGKNNDHYFTLMIDLTIIGIDES